MKRVLVIGSNSFSGSHMVASLLRKGYHVVGVSRSAEPDPVFLPYAWDGLAGFSFQQLDLNKDLAAIIELVKENEFPYIVNFAAQGMVAESWQNPGDWFKTNTLSQVMLHDQLRHCDFLEKYVHVSTPEVYGCISENTGECTTYQPTTPYAVSRAATDMSLMAFFKAYRFPVVFTRSANVYGPGQQLYRLIPRTMMAVLTGRKMQLNNGGCSQRSFIHIQDVTHATLSIMERGTPGEIYHIAGRRLFSIHEIAELSAKAVGGTLEEIADIAPPRLGRDSIYNLNSDKIRTELNWCDETSLENGIAETAGWVVTNLSTLSEHPLCYEHKP